MPCVPKWGPLEIEYCNVHFFNLEVYFLLEMTVLLCLTRLTKGMVAIKARARQQVCHKLHLRACMWSSVRNIHTERGKLISQYYYYYYYYYGGTR
jgi:hypothetical protein